MWGSLRGRGGAGLGKRREGEGGEVKGRAREGPKLLLNQGPSDSCYATSMQWRRNWGFRRFNEPRPPSSWGPK